MMPRARGKLRTSAPSPTYRVLFSALSFLAVAGAAWWLAASGVLYCGPATYGPQCSLEGIGYVIPLAGGIVLSAVWGVALFFPIPLAWLTGLLVSQLTTPANTGRFEVTLTGAVVLIALGLALWIDARNFNDRKARERSSSPSS